MRSNHDSRRSPERNHETVFFTDHKAAYEGEELEENM